MTISIPILHIRKQTQSNLPVITLGLEAFSSSQFLTCTWETVPVCALYLQRISFYFLFFWRRAEGEAEAVQATLGQTSWQPPPKKTPHTSSYLVQGDKIRVKLTNAGPTPHNPSLQEVRLLPPASSSLTPQLRPVLTALMQDSGLGVGGTPGDGQSQRARCLTAERWRADLPRPQGYPWSPLPTACIRSHLFSAE